MRIAEKYTNRKIFQKRRETVNKLYDKTYKTLDRGTQDLPQLVSNNNTQNFDNIYSLYQKTMNRGKVVNSPRRATQLSLRRATQLIPKCRHRLKSLSHKK